jgi:DNA-binding XRE family transcriptional regulator
MTAEEYKTTRKRLGMTQAALADVLDVSRKTINQRESSGLITKEAAMALELLELQRKAKR